MKETNNWGRAIYYVASCLSIPLKDFVEYLAEADGENRISSKTLYKAATGSYIRKRWSFDEFWRRADCAILQYADGAKLNRNDKRNIIQTWEQGKDVFESDCRELFFDIDAPERSADFPFVAQALSGHFEDNKTAMIDALRPILRSLGEQNKRILYTYEKNFPAFSSITEYDLKFIIGILKMSPEEKAGLKERMRTQQTVDAVTILERFNREELRHWIAVRNESYAGASRKREGIEKSVDQFCEQCGKLSGWRLFILLKFLVFTLAGPDVVTRIDNSADLNTKVILDPNRFSTAEIDLFLMFKYILTEDAQSQIMNIL